jgi:hypothetical protein
VNVIETWAEKAPNPRIETRYLRAPWRRIETLDAREPKPTIETQWMERTANGERIGRLDLQRVTRMNRG